MAQIGQQPVAYIDHCGSLGFALHWDLDDLIKAMGARPVMWTDPANWMNRIVSLRGSYEYRYILGDTTDLADAQDDAYTDEFLK